MDIYLYIASFGAITTVIYYFAKLNTHALKPVPFLTAFLVGALWPVIAPLCFLIPGLWDSLNFKFEENKKLRAEFDLLFPVIVEVLNYPEFRNALLDTDDVTFVANRFKERIWKNYTSKLEQLRKDNNEGTGETNE